MWFLLFFSFPALKFGKLIWSHWCLWMHTDVIKKVTLSSDWVTWWNLLLWRISLLLCCTLFPPTVISRSHSAFLVVHQCRRHEFQHELNHCCRPFLVCVPHYCEPRNRSEIEQYTRLAHHTPEDFGQFSQFLHSKWQEDNNREWCLRTWHAKFMYTARTYPMIVNVESFCLK